MYYKNIIKLLFLLIFVYFISVNSFAEIKTIRTNPTDILIFYETFNPLTPTRFIGSEQPFRCNEFTIFFDINILTNYNFVSDVPNEKRTENFRRNSFLSITAIFVLDKFSTGIKLELNFFNIISDRTIEENNSGVLTKYNINEKRLFFNLYTWLGYKIFDNLGIGFDLIYNTFYSYFYYDFIVIPGSPEPFSTFWKIGEDKLFFGPSISWKPFSFFRFTYRLMAVYKRRIEHYYYIKDSFINLDNLLKLVFIPFTDKLFITLESQYSFFIGKNYDDCVFYNSWYKETILSIFLSIDWFIISKIFYLRAGGFFEDIYRPRSEASKVRAFLKPHNDMYQNSYGFIFGIGYSFSEFFMLSIDFIYKYHIFPKYKLITSLIDWFSSFSKVQLLISTRYQF